MSFGFGIGDSIAVGELCWKLYSQVYKVSRDAPEELRGLNQELGNLHNTIQLLIEELKDEDSVLIRSGDVRINTVRRVMSQSEETLKRMQQLSERYAELQTPSVGRQKRQALRIYWDRLKYSRELHTINDLRAKIMLHNSQLALILQGAQNSSLERIEKQNTQTDKKLDELRQLFTSDRASRDRPILTAPLDPNALMELTNVFLQKAELDNRPWASIGIDNWLQAGQWWLMKVQSQLEVAPQSHEDQAIHNQGYANLLKACWILTDIIAIHPQRTHMGSSNDRRAHYIQRLTQGAISKLKPLSINMLPLKDLLTCNLDIWTLPPSTALTPSRRDTGHQPELKWQTHDGQILFQKFAEYQDDKLELPVECIVIIEMPNKQSTNTALLNLIVQNSMGQDIYKRQTTSGINSDLVDTEDFPIRFIAKQDERFLICILKSVYVFQYSLKPLPVDASMIYSAALLRICLNARESLIDCTFKSSTVSGDINLLTRSRQELQIISTTRISSSFQLLVDRIVQYIKKCSECFPRNSDRTFWMQEHHCIWMLIYWVCDTFEAFSEIFNEIGIRSPDFHPVSENCLIGCSLLLKDTEFPQKFRSSMNLNPYWVLERIDIMFIAIHEDDTALLQTVIKKTEEELLKQNWTQAWELAFATLKWDAMDILLSASGVNRKTIYQALLWFIDHHEWRGLQILSDLTRPRGEYLVSISEFEQDFPKLYESITLNCAEIIYKGSLHHLEMFLDAVQQLGVSFTIKYGALATQSVILPALASRKLSVLKLLSSKCVVSIPLKAFDRDYYVRYTRHRALRGLPIPEWPLELAIAFVLDLEIVEYLCQAGAHLEKSRSDEHLEEPEILRNVRLTTSVADARKQNCHIKATCYKLCFAANNVGIPFHEHVRRGELWPKSYKFSETWMITSRIIFEDDCRHLYDNTDELPGFTWPAIQKKLYPPDLKDVSIKEGNSWPVPLSTQETWDDWRLKVIDVLERTHQGHFKPPSGFEGQPLWRGLRNT